MTLLDDAPPRFPMQASGRHRVTVIDLGARRSPTALPFVAPATSWNTADLDAFRAELPPPTPPSPKPLAHASPRRRDLRLQAKAEAPPSWWATHRNWLLSVGVILVILVFAGQLGSSGADAQANAQSANTVVGIAGSGTPAQAKKPAAGASAKPAARNKPAAKGTRMVVSAYALNVRKVHTTKGNRPLTALRKGTKVTVLAVTKASASPDNQTRWAKTQAGWMWYGGLDKLGSKSAAKQPSSRHHAATATTRHYGKPGSGAYKAAVKAYAKSRFAKYGWSVSAQFGCLNQLWIRESGWNHQAYNKHGGATGIPQSLPGRKMASEGSDWRTNPETQIDWGLKYIAGRYHTPCGAWAHSESHNPHWY